MTDLDVLWRAARKLRRVRTRGKTLPPLLFFTDPIRTPLPEEVVARLPRGAGVVYRAFGDADAVQKARRLATLARLRGVRLFVGADIALALAARADGVHLPERLAHRAGWNRRLRRRFILTAAAHGLTAVRRARRAGVDAVVISPVFPSASPSAGRPLGLRRFSILARASGTPSYALGGVNARTVAGLAGSGAAGIAAVEALTLATTGPRT